MDQTQQNTSVPYLYQKPSFYRQTTITNDGGSATITRKNIRKHYRYLGIGKKPVRIVEEYNISGFEFFKKN